MPDGTNREPATEPEDLGRMFVERANAGDLDGTWRWIIDQPNILG